MSVPYLPPAASSYANAPEPRPPSRRDPHDVESHVPDRRRHGRGRRHRDRHVVVLARFRKVGDLGPILRAARRESAWLREVTS
jgi:hypothetical protein